MRTSPSPGPADPALPGARDRARLAFAAGAVLLASADTYVVVLALTAIIGDIGIPVDQLQRAAPIVSGFLLGYVAVLPLLGRLSDLWGRSPVLLGCLAVFATGSLVTASAPTLIAVVAGRTLQGLGGGGLVPVTLALVADRWPPERRGPPLGVVGAAQEVGSVLGPVYGAAVVTLSGWRTIFWLNLPFAAVLLAGLVASGPRQGRDAGRRGPEEVGERGPEGTGGPPGERGVGAGSEGRRFDVVGAVLLAVVITAGVAAIIEPSALVDSYTFGALYAPVAGLTPVALAAAAAGVLLVAWELLLPGRVRPLLPLRRLPGLLGETDWPGAVLLAVVLGLVVVAFASADPTREVLAPGAGGLLAAALVAAVVLVAAERRSRHPLIPAAALRSRPSLGALLTNLALGAALIGVLVDVPIFARETAFPDSQVGAALVLVRLLAAVPVGALAGGALCGPWGNRSTAAAGMALSAAMLFLMSTWSASTLGRPLLGLGWLHPSDPVLVAAGLGFGLAIAPVNAAILAAVRTSLHGLASALVIVARSIGMLVGLSVLTALGLHSFAVSAAAVPSPLILCPGRPGHCPAYESALAGAAVTELDTIFRGAAVCALAAAAVAACTLQARGRARA